MNILLDELIDNKAVRGKKVVFDATFIKAYSKRDLHDNARAAMIEDRKLDGTNFFRQISSFLSFTFIFSFAAGLFCIVVIRDSVEHSDDGGGDYSEDFVFLFSGEF